MDWKKGEDSFEMRVTLPGNSKTRLSVPTLGFKNVVISESGGTFWKNGKFTREVPGINAGTESDDYVEFDVGSGYYYFHVTTE